MKPDTLDVLNNPMESFIGAGKKPMPFATALGAAADLCTSSMDTNSQYSFNMSQHATLEVASTTDSGLITVPEFVDASKAAYAGFLIARLEHSY
ncbi:hypothetical protein, partial [Paraburkholderia hospita]